MPDDEVKMETDEVQEEEMDEDSRESVKKEGRYAFIDCNFVIYRSLFGLRHSEFDRFDIFEKRRKRDRDPREI